MMTTKTLENLHEDRFGASHWVYDAEEAAEFSLVSGKHTCRLSFQDHVGDTYPLTFYIVDLTDVVDEDPAAQPTADDALDEFSCGSNERPPCRHVVDLARRLSAAVIDSTTEPEITVDTDGALAFDLRLKNGLLMFAELHVDGSLSLTTFDDSRATTSVVDHVPSASESQFLDRLQV